ncbi:hypothetical protein NN561_006350 [Cricetulus griseus]
MSEPKSSGQAVARGKAAPRGRHGVRPPAAEPGPRPGQPPPAPGKPGESGLRRRCPRAWCGVCTLRSLSRGDCSKAVEKSAAVPLPVEAAAVAVAEDAHWRSRRSPRHHRPRPRCASARTRPRRVRPQHPGTVRMVYAPGRPVCLAVAHLGLVFQNLTPQPGSCSSSVRATSACGLLSSELHRRPLLAWLTALLVPASRDWILLRKRLGKEGFSLKS